MEYTIIPAGASAVNITMPNRIDPEINQFILALMHQLKKYISDGIQAMVPAYRTLTVFYRSDQLTMPQITQIINDEAATIVVEDSKTKHVLHIPVCYEEPFAPDMEFVAAHAHLTTREVIAAHCRPDYLIYMLGFLPGFVYLGGLASEIATPRLGTPRKAVPAGAVGIAGAQTGMYPIESPGGWQIIGQTPVQLFDVNRTPVIYYHAGDYIHFDAISSREYWEWRRNPQKLRLTEERC